MSKVPPSYPACTNKQKAEMAGRTYSYDCARCPECKESIRLLKLQMAASAEAAGT